MECMDQLDEYLRSMQELQARARGPPLIVLDR